MMFLLFPLLGVVAGILAGLLGIGGGLVLVAALAWLLPLFGVPQDAAMHAALASSLASIVLTAASSARAHARRGSVLWPTVAWMVPGLLLGAWLGSGLAVALDDGVLRWIVAVYCLVAAWQIGFGRTRAPADGSEATVVGYDAQKGELFVDTTNASRRGLGLKVREAGPLKLASGEPLKHRVLLDRSVIEVFANDRQAITRRIYPDAASTGIEAFATGAGARLQDLTIWDMMPSNPY